MCSFGYILALQVGGLMDQAPSNPIESEVRLWAMIVARSGTLFPG